MGELPIEGPIARVAVEAHRHRLTVIRRRALVGSRSPVWSSADGVARSAASPVDVADGTQVASGLAAAVVIPASASCALGHL